MKILILFSALISITLGAVVTGPGQNDVIMEVIRQTMDHIQKSGHVLPSKTMFEIIIPQKQNIPLMDNVHNVNPQFIEIMSPPKPTQPTEFEYFVPLSMEYQAPPKNAPMMEMMPPKPAEYLVPPSPKPPKLFDYSVPQNQFTFMMPPKPVDYLSPPRPAHPMDIDYFMPQNRFDFMGPQRPAQYMLPPPPMDPPMWHPPMMNVEQHSVPHPPMHEPMPNYLRNDVLPYYPMNNNPYFQPIPPQMPVNPYFIPNEFIPQHPPPTYDYFHPVYYYYVPQQSPRMPRHAWY